VIWLPTDFGYSATAISIKLGKSTGGTLNFLAPERTISASSEMKEHANKPTADNCAFAMSGDVPYNDMDPSEICSLKHSDKELTSLLKQLPDDTPECFRDVITAMTKYNPEDRTNLATVREMMGFDDARYSIILRSWFEDSRSNLWTGIDLVIQRHERRSRRL